MLQSKRQILAGVLLVLADRMKVIWYPVHSHLRAKRTKGKMKRLESPFTPFEFCSVSVRLG
jgi:hypothetical protein